MNFIIISNYYYPETGAAPNRITNLAEGLAERGNVIDVICPLPNYPEARILDGYKNKFCYHEERNRVKIHRYWIYPSASKNRILRILSMFSFSFSLWFYAIQRKKILLNDWIIVQHSPLLVSFSAIVLFKNVYRRRIALNVSDIWPLTALELNAIKKGRFYRFLEWIEKFNYTHSDVIIGQSEEILEHVEAISNKRGFLYRNIQPNSYVPADSNYTVNEQFKIVYAGLLGVAQGVFNIINEIDFSELGVQFDIYGHGNEKDKIVNFIHDHPYRNVAYKGSLGRNELISVLPQYHAAIVPLVKRIRGAVPSKIFELMQMQIPVFFCGGGEGAKIVEKYKVGLTSPPGDHNALKESIVVLKNMTEVEYKSIKNNCVSAAKEQFNFNQQLDRLMHALSNE